MTYLHSEKAENEIWQGIKSEKEGNLKLAAFHYRSAIKHNPECSKAHRLLSFVLKKNQDVRSEQIAKVESKQSNKTNLVRGSNASTAKSDNSSGWLNRTITNELAPTIAKNALKANRNKSRNLGISGFSNANLTPVNVNLNVNNPNLSSQQKSEVVLLPSMEVSPSGDMVLQDNLTVSKLYVEQALAFFDRQEWIKSIAACKEALKSCPSVGKAYKVWGDCLQQSGNSVDAIGIYAKALELQPDMPQVYCNLGSIYAKSRKWQQAIEYYQKSILIDSNCAAPYRNLARVWDELEEYDKSEECFFKAVAIKPELITAENHFDLAHNLAEENKIDKAIACYKAFIKLEPTYLNAYVRLAQLLEKDGQTEEALYYYKKLAQLQTGTKEDKSQSKSRQQIHKFLFSQKPRQNAIKSPSKTPLALEGGGDKKIAPLLTSGTPSNKQDKIAQCKQKAEQQPNSASIQYELGNLYFVAKEWQNAITCYLKAIKLEPRQTNYYLNLGKAWAKSGDAIKANQSFYQAFSLESDKVTGQNHLLLGNKLLEQRQIKPAIACYRRAIIQNPKLLESYWQLGRILLSGGNEQGAIACYKQAIKVDPQNSRSYFCLGNAYAQTNQEEAAISCYQKAVEIDPNDADIQHNLGEVFSKIENWPDAMTSYQKAIALNPNNSWSYNNLGNALLKVENWLAAANSFRRAVELKPDFVWSHYNLGEALSELQQWDKALTAYKLAQQLDPNLPLVKQKIGRILYRRSKNSQQEAASFYAAQITEDPDNIKLYHQAISLNRKNHLLYLGLGKALARQEKIDEAISIFQMGLAIQPSNSELRLELDGAILAKKKELSLPQANSNVVETLSPVSYGSFANSDLCAPQLPTHEFPLVSIIIPVYNQISYTLNCLRSIANNVSSHLAIEVIVVNDCSTDNTDKILKQIEGLKQIDNSHNLGFLKSCNRGFAAAEGEYVYFLNNDTELLPQSLEHLVSVCQQDADVGAVGSKLIYPDGSLQEAGGIIWQDASGWNYGKNENALDPQYNYLRPVDYCSGASLLVRKSTLLSLYGFDSDFAPAYYEDTDLCFTIRHLLGLKVMYQPKSEVFHHEGISCGTELNKGIKQYQSVNMTKFATKWEKELQDYPLNQNNLSVAAACRRHSGNKTILVIDIYAPCYDKESGSRRIWELLQIFKQLDYHVIFVPDNGAKEEPYVGMLQSKGIEVIYTQSGYGKPIEEQLKELLPLVDIAWICRPQLYEKYAPLIRKCDRIKLVYDTVDLHYLRLQRAGQFSDSGKSIENMRQWVRMQSRELKAAHDADLTITITDTEQKILQQQQVNNLAVVPNIHSPYVGEKPDLSAREGLLFIGSYNHPPNVDAVFWLVKEIMPIVWQKIPELTITLLGNNPTAEIIALGKDLRIKVTGYIQDVTSYFISHRVFVAPLRYGAGMKGKIGQSLEYGLPIVSTAIGVEGMNLIAEEHILQAEHSNEFAEQVIKLYQDENLWYKLANNSHNAIAFITPEVIKHNLKYLLSNLIENS